MTILAILEFNPRVPMKSKIIAETSIYLGIRGGVQDHIILFQMKSWKIREKAKEKHIRSEKWVEGTPK